MARYAILIVAVLGSAATAFATISPGSAALGVQHKNISVFYKGDVEAEARPLVLEECAKEDCSDTPSHS